MLASLPHLLAVSVNESKTGKSTRIDPCQIRGITSFPALRAGYVQIVYATIIRKTMYGITTKTVIVANLMLMIASIAVKYQHCGLNGVKRMDASNGPLDKRASFRCNLMNCCSCIVC